MPILNRKFIACIPRSLSANEARKLSKQKSACTKAGGYWSKGAKQSCHCPTRVSKLDKKTLMPGIYVPNKGCIETNTVCTEYGGIYNWKTKTCTIKEKIYNLGQLKKLVQ